MATFCTGDGFEVDENGRLQLATGCGLEQGGDGVQVTARDASEWPYMCEPEDGVQPWCDNSGVLRLPPEHTGASDFLSVASGQAHPTTVPPGQRFFAPNGPDLDVTAPDCRDLLLHLQFGVGGSAIIQPGGYARLAYRRDLGDGTLSGAVVFEGYGNPAQAAGPFAVNFDTTRDFFNVLVPAGTTLTFRGRAAMGNLTPPDIAAADPVAFDESGDVIWTRSALSIRYWGWTV